MSNMRLSKQHRAIQGISVAIEIYYSRKERYFQNAFMIFNFFHATLNNIQKYKKLLQLEELVFSG